jgi:hypothetical protein
MNSEVTKTLTVNCARALILHGDAAVFDKADHIAINCASAVITDEAYAKLLERGVSINTAAQQIIKLEGETLRLPDTTHINDQSMYHNKWLIGKEIWIDTMDPAPGGALGIIANNVYSCENQPFSIPVYANLIEYPENAVKLTQQNITLSTTYLSGFPKDSILWSRWKIDALDDDALSLLKEQGIKIYCHKIVLHEWASRLADHLLFAKKYMIVPDGSQLIDGDLTLDEFTSDMYGTSIYVTGTITIPFDGESLLQKFNRIQCDSVFLPSNALATWKKIGKTQNMHPYKGKLWRIDGKETITHEQLNPIGDVPFTLYVDGMVTFSSDVTAEDMKAFCGVYYDGVCTVPAAAKAALQAIVKNGDGPILTTESGSSSLKSFIDKLISPDEDNPQNQQNVTINTSFFEV